MPEPQFRNPTEYVWKVGSQQAVSDGQVTNLKESLLQHKGDKAIILNYHLS